MRGDAGESANTGCLKLAGVAAVCWLVLASIVLLEVGKWPSTAVHWVLAIVLGPPCFILFSALGEGVAKAGEAGVDRLGLGSFGRILFGVILGVAVMLAGLLISVWLGTGP